MGSGALRCAGPRALAAGYSAHCMHLQPPADQPSTRPAPNRQRSDAGVEAATNGPAALAARAATGALRQRCRGGRLAAGGQATESANLVCRRSKQSTDSKLLITCDSEAAAVGAMPTSHPQRWPGDGPPASASMSCGALAEPTVWAMVPAMPMPSLASPVSCTHGWQHT